MQKRCHFKLTRDALFSDEECKSMCDYIDGEFHRHDDDEYAESEEDASFQGDGVYRRFTLKDVSLAEKVQGFLEHEKSRDRDIASILPPDYLVNHLWFFTRYPSPRGRLDPHVDGQTISEDGASVLTLLVYLNDGFRGGETVILDDYENDKNNNEEGGFESITDSISPKTGHGLLLRQDVLHRANSVTKGTKYMLRGDIMVPMVRRRRSS